MKTKVAKNILVIRRDNIGDLVCTTPLLTALRSQYPNARIGVLANSYNAPVLAHNADIDDLYAYQKLKHLGKEGGALLAIAHRLAMMWRLRRQKLDLVVLASGASDSSGARMANLLAPRLVLCAEPPAPGQHEVERTFSVARQLGEEGPIPPVRVTADTKAIARVRRAMRLADVQSPVVVGVHLSARRPKQQWPADRFADLILALHREQGAATMLFWSPGAGDNPQHPGDDDKARAVIDRVGKGAKVLPWRTTELADLVGGLAQCDAVICSDGGAMHVAAGLGKPIVCFFGDSPVHRWHPWGVRHVVLQPASGDVHDVSIEHAVMAASDLLPAFAQGHPVS